MLEVADSRGLVRDDLHRRVVEAYFEAAVINVMEHPALVSLNLSLGEIYSTASSIFMHGILKDRADEPAALTRHLIQNRKDDFMSSQDKSTDGSTPEASSRHSERGASSLWSPSRGDVRRSRTTSTARACRRPGA